MVKFPWCWPATRRLPSPVVRRRTRLYGEDEGDDTDEESEP